MFKARKKQLPLILFVVAALFSFVSFLVMGLFFVASNAYGNVVLRQDRTALDPGDSDRYFLNTDYEHKDPYTTKIPNLRDMLKGPIVTSRDPSIGNINSPVVLVLFSDFECSYCKNQEEILREMVDKYDIRLVWKDYPSSHKASRSFQAAIASRCAQTENGFWDYHNKLYENNSELNKDQFLRIAQELHMDMDDFGKCLDDMSTAYMIEDNMKEAEALDINGVPFLFVNDQELLGEINKADLERIIELELEKYE